MHEHDQDLIMALAEGTLAAAAATAAEAEIGACAECARDLELQRLAVAVLDDTPRAYLTAVESARLHQRLHQQLAVTGSRPPSPAPRPATGRRQAWGRWVGLAAGAAAVFVAAFLVLPSLGGLGGSDDDASSEMVAMDGATETSAAPETAAAPQMREEFAGATDDAGGADAALESDMAETTAAASATTTTAGPSTEDPDADAANFLSWFVVGDLDEELRAQVLDQFSFDREYLGFADEQIKSINPNWAACVDGLVASGRFSSTDAQIVGVIVAESGENAGMERLLVAFIASDIGDTTLASITIPECEVFETLP